MRTAGLSGWRGPESGRMARICELCPVHLATGDTEQNSISHLLQETRQNGRPELNTIQSYSEGPVISALHIAMKIKAVFPLKWTVSSTEKVHTIIMDILMFQKHIDTFIKYMIHIKCNYK